MTDDIPAGALPLWLFCRVHGFPGPDPPAVPGVAPEDVAAELRAIEHRARAERAHWERRAWAFIATGRWG